MWDSQLVWARDSHQGYIQGRITEIGADEYEVQPLDSKQPRRNCILEDIFASCEAVSDHDDNCELMFLNEATLLDNIKNRYYKDKIYTYVANILIAVNPYKEIRDLYSKATIKRYNGKSLGELPPHVYAIADKAIRDMRVLKVSQSIIVSGESGAGKTESTKYLLRYLCDAAATAGPIEQKILDANPILEAFGNAKTTRNNNSSRFGKFIEVHYDSKCQVVGGYISHYLLEKSRICTQSAEERNYHVFYLLCAGAPQQLRDKLLIGKPDDYRYLAGCTQYFSTSQTDRKIPNSQKSKDHLSRGSLKDPILDDYNDFQDLDQALARLGLSDVQKFQIYGLVAAVLHLGNICFEENPEDAKGGCRVTHGSEKALVITGSLIGLDPSELRQALVSRVMQSKGGGIKGTVIMVPLKVYEANNARDALAKALYSRLFDYIVQLINQNIPFQASSYYIGVLDIAGFEYFTVNSFEQFCINYCNEKLQKFFNDNILAAEQDLYKREGLNVPEIKFTDNQDIIELIESKSSGIFNLLDEESKLPKPSFSHFTNEVHSAWQGHFRLSLPRASRLKAHRGIRDDEGFLVHHFAGAVCYNTNQFIEKNNDALHASLEGLVQESENPLLKRLFVSGKVTATKGKLAFISVGSKFKTQLGELMDKLEKNGTNFIRCIKPNSRMIDHEFEGSLALAQLKCSGTTSVLELMEYGYPSRVPFNELYNMYISFLPPELARLNPRTFCEAMLHSLKLNNKDFKFGITKVFFRPGKFVEFDRIMKSDPENLRAIVANVKKWLVRSRWIKSVFCAICVIKLKNRIIYRNKCVLVIQKTVRGYQARKQHQPRIKGIVKIKAIKTSLGKMQEIANQLKAERESMLKQVVDVTRAIDDAIRKIKANPKISAAEIDSLHNGVMAKIDAQMKMIHIKLQEQRNAEEQERLRKIQAAFEAERKAKEAEERLLREEEENRRKKAEMEARRKEEEIRRLKQEEEDRKAALALQAQLEKEAQEDTKYRQQLEQERRDHELALRLAQESNGQVEDSPPLLRNGTPEVTPLGNPNRLIRSEAIRAQQQLIEKQKHDLSKWKYSELRDAINTSCDIELLEACRHEFHRRLKVYHAWKAKNRKRTTMDENERAPRSVMEAAARAPPRLSQKQEITTGSVHRYFRIPFVRPSINPEDNNKRGWWYAHFDGQYVARQMELHADKPPILLVAGVDDMQMCELSLEETGLTRKRGAEILEHEFNREWERNGGKPFKKVGK
ncbi:myosin heavy chain 95F isoform X1 [Malaya genurostris]|uniref:myosin heavy chain 95F isoform X1 n=1 Tax=Malaya genurostris TaxID=325434 RepID=UPI0026F3E4B4|nr:myosin heavy chain 95F isoform X1 [Malaya genurostris]XP_058443587.1 myosin heavy chain 95F isoform X1 [Malaya genurostris]XP_058443588.1 myosin heavy chain 95F isoform X1 [Malaya genurostris]XP_058443589.1 myosin heavy chain 95F isoform X1 [Malaya genurostris]XP_058443590.1 myosin heavy chain 95F isoform X1 [Malaya genurostris]